jgi:hypothetical protein
MKFLKTTLVAASVAVLSTFALPEGAASSADAGYWHRQGRQVGNYYERQGRQAGNYWQRQGRQEARRWDNNFTYRSWYGPARTRVIVR